MAAGVATYGGYRSKGLWRPVLFGVAIVAGYAAASTAFFARTGRAMARRFGDY